MNTGKMEVIGNSGNPLRELEGTELALVAGGETQRIENNATHGGGYATPPAVSIGGTWYTGGGGSRYAPRFILL